GNWTCAYGVEHPSPDRKKAGTTEQALLTNHKPEPPVMFCPSKFPKPATPLITYCTSFVCFSGWR
uniref:Prolactin receptor n=1 Tax=Mesocestoides corti TaxID=53468 RepID=A0A5K3FYN0_MESCO